MSEEVMMQYSKMEELNRIWEVIEDAIIKVEKKVLPSKVIKNELGKQNPRLKECRDLKAIKLLSILISAIRKNQDSRSVADWRKWNKLINRINQLRLVQSRNNEEKLIIEEEEILRETARFFQNQYRSKSPKLNQMNKDWRRVHQPIKQIKESWYKDLTEPLSVSE
ncbi:15178_t:CDS:2 [Gigaspora margarita]|uniref:15178_t:CDS:1 n=1 Tax=Gigaspora margarita TaxID=4874 RepID=A0ABN7WXK1_GIGMA|nr:15178_t:CDS:2 [Gigaspora margarita]